MKKVINVSTINDKICNLQQVITELSRSMADGGPIYVSLISEGPCCTHIGLYQLLDNLCLAYNYDKSLISIDTSNLLEKHPEFNIKKNFNFWELEKARENTQQITNLDKTFDQRFKHFGQFIGHGNIHRLRLGSHLYNNFRSQTLQTYHFSTSDYHREFVGIEDLIYANVSKELVLEAVNFLYECPLKLDEVQTYPILQPANISIGNYYHLFFVEIVNLTYFTGDIFYVDEKIWRPMLLKTPFLVQGPQNFLVNLKKLGFKTFDKYWREDYTLDPDNCQPDIIIENIQNLSTLSLGELQDMYSDMQDILIHNYNLALTISKTTVESVNFNA